MSLFNAWDLIRHTDWLYVVHRGFGWITEVQIKHDHLYAKADLEGDVTAEEIWAVARRLKGELVMQQRTADAVAKALTP